MITVEFNTPIGVYTTAPLEATTQDFLDKIAQVVHSETEGGADFKLENGGTVFFPVDVLRRSVIGVYDA